MPGATLTSRDGEEFAGSVKVKLGPVSMVYNGTARFVEQDVVARRAVIEAAGKDTKGTSTARATVRAVLTPESDQSTRVDVVTDLAITGRPAQFGRGVMQDVAGRIIDQFAANLAHVMGAEAGATSEDDAAAPPAPAPAKKAAKRTTKKATVTTSKVTTSKAATAKATSAGKKAVEEPPQAPPVQPVETAPQAPSAAPAPSKHEMPHPHDAIDLIEHAGAPVLKRAVPVLAGFVVLWVLWRLLRRRG
jgi:carbon monoxide dehydrogenase subunit G